MSGGRLIYWRQRRLYRPGCSPSGVRLSPSLPQSFNCRERLGCRVKGAPSSRRLRRSASPPFDPTPQPHVKLRIRTEREGLVGAVSGPKVGTCSAHVPCSLCSGPVARLGGGPALWPLERSVSVTGGGLGVGAHVVPLGRWRRLALWPRRRSLRVSRGGSARGRLELSLPVSIGGRQAGLPGNPLRFQEAAASLTGVGDPLRSQEAPPSALALRSACVRCGPYRSQRAERAARPKEPHPGATPNHQGTTRPNPAETQTQAGGPGGAAPPAGVWGLGPHKTMRNDPGLLSQQTGIASSCSPDGI